jgi:hypothetical protein
MALCNITATFPSLNPKNPAMDRFDSPPENFKPIMSLSRRASRATARINPCADSLLSSLSSGVGDIDLSSRASLKRTSFSRVRRL